MCVRSRLDPAEPEYECEHCGAQYSSERARDGCCENAERAL